jgi:AraC family transcriptional regulator
MQPQIVTKPAFSVVGMHIHTKPMSSEIPDLWGQFAPRMNEVPHPTEADTSYGVMYHSDQTMDKMEYMAGLPVEKMDSLPAGMTHWELAANTYAVFETTLLTISDTFGYIFNTWLPASGYQTVDAPYFERYGESFNPHDPDSTLSIYIPVTPYRIRKK